VVVEHVPGDRDARRRKHQLPPAPQKPSAATLVTTYMTGRPSVPIVAREKKTSIGAAPPAAKTISSARSKTITTASPRIGARAR